MPIRVDCPTCGLKLEAPDSAAGKRVRCSGCKAVMTVPENVVEAEPFGEPEPPRAARLPAPSARGYDVGTGPAQGGDERRPCPMCGEMIPTAAAKCRFCGEIFDPTLRRIEEKKKVKSTDTDLSAGEWAVAILCSGIGCIAGVIWMIQGKPKGGKMLGVSFLAGIFWGVVRAILEGAMKQH